MLFYSQNFKLFPHTTENLYPDYEPNDVVVPEISKGLFDLNVTYDNDRVDTLLKESPKFEDFHSSGMSIDELKRKFNLSKRNFATTDS